MRFKQNASKLKIVMFKTRYWFLLIVLFFLGENCLFAKDQFYSQASQDQFVYELLYDLLHKQDAGYYLEIGAGHPTENNNTFYFETRCGWKGLSIDISDSYKKHWKNIRKNRLLVEDATTCDYRSILKDAPSVIDYLSLDVDMDYDIVLQLIPFNEYTFKVITIEHDSYRFGDIYKDKEREILKSLGYSLLCADVSLDWNHNSCIQQCAFEDWWVHSSLLSDSLLHRLQELNLEKNDHAQIVQKLRLASQATVQ